MTKNIVLVQNVALNFVLVQENLTKYCINKIKYHEDFLQFFKKGTFWHQIWKIFVKVRWQNRPLQNRPRCKFAQTAKLPMPFRNSKSPTPESLIPESSRIVQNCLELSRIVRWQQCDQKWRFWGKNLLIKML